MHPETSVGLCRYQDYALFCDLLVGGGAAAGSKVCPGLNIAQEAVDRYVSAGRGGKLALRWRRPINISVCMGSDMPCRHVMSEGCRRAVLSSICAIRRAAAARLASASWQSRS